jgi:ABC-type sugar transport system substrate-binding protein
MNALIICAEDEDRAKKSCLPLILKANEHAIPVLFIHAGIEEQYLKEKNARVECLISADNLKGGALAGEYIAKRTGRAGPVLMLEGSLQSYGGSKRRQGFLDAVRKYPAMTCMEVVDLDWTREMALATSRKMFGKHPDIKAVFAFCDMMAIGAADAARFSSLPGLTIVGFDGSEQGRAALREGRIAATVNQSPYEIGRLGILCAIKALHGEKLPFYIYTKTELITEESLRLPFQK